MGRIIGTTGCCVVRLLIIGLILGFIVGIVWYVAPAVKHDAAKISHDVRAARKNGSGGK